MRPSGIWTRGRSLNSAECKPRPAGGSCHHDDDAPPPPYDPPPPDHELSFELLDEDDEPDEEDPELSELPL